MTPEEELEKIAEQSGHPCSQPYLRHEGALMFVDGRVSLEQLKALVAYMEKAKG